MRDYYFKIFVDGRLVKSTLSGAVANGYFEKMLSKFYPYKSVYMYKIKRRKLSTGDTTNNKLKNNKKIKCQEKNIKSYPQNLRGVQKLHHPPVQILHPEIKESFLNKKTCARVNAREKEFLACRQKSRSGNGQYEKNIGCTGLNKEKRTFCRIASIAELLGKYKLVKLRIASLFSNRKVKHGKYGTNKH